MSAITFNGQGKTRNACLGCGTPYMKQSGTTADTDGWWHFDRYRGPAPLQGPKAPIYLLTGSMCGPCSDEHLYKSQDVFEAFVRQLAVTHKLEST